jgi:hypothetical protein
MKRSWIAMVALTMAGALGTLWPAAAHAEPYLAVRMGLKCGICHENPTGGGLRTAFGNTYAQTQLAANRIDFGDVGPWTGAVSRFLSVGADLRATGTVTDIPGGDTRDEFDVQELRVYLQLNAIPNRLALYADQRFAPGTSSNLEAYAKLWFGNRQWYVKAGQMYLPFGLRLEDDTAFTRQVSGINMTTPDKGVELGWESAYWRAQLALSNGTAGAPEQDDGKQFSFNVEQVRSRWRIGASANFNDAAVGDRKAVGAFAGLRTGPVVWLTEVDRIVDDGFPGAAREMWAGLIEANWAFLPGHNLKLTAEGFEPDRDVAHDEQSRYSLLWEYTPLPFVQLRVGGRLYDGIPQNGLQNRKLLIAELHAYF